jgi:redox-regulated HSP33 family molecular chaperone
MRAARALRAPPAAATIAAAAAYQLRRDAVLKVWTPHLRLVLVTATRTANEAVRRHGLASPAGAALLAKTAAGAALLSASLKGEERAVLQLVEHEGGDPGGPAARRLYAEAMAVGEVRAYAAPADGGGGGWPARLPPSPASSLSVTSILYGSAVPHQSLVGCTTGDVAGDLAEYFSRSAQVPTHVLLEAEVAAADGSGAQQAAAAAGGVPPPPRLSFVGGLLVQRIARGGGSQPRPEVLAAQAGYGDDDDDDGTSGGGGSSATTAVKWSTLEDVKARLAAVSAGGDSGSTASLLGALLSDGLEDEAGEDAINNGTTAAADNASDATTTSTSSPSSSAAASASLPRPFTLAECARRGLALPAVARALLPELAGLLPPDAGMIGSNSNSSSGGGLADDEAPSPAAAVPPVVGTVRVPLDFYCRCSKDGFLTKLGRSSSPDLLRDLLRQGSASSSSSSSSSSATPAPPPAAAAATATAAADDHVCTSLTCQFCNTEYPVTAGDLAGLLAERALEEARQH